MTCYCTVLGIGEQRRLIPALMALTAYQVPQMWISEYK